AMDLKIEIQILGGLILGSLATWIWIARLIAAGKPLVRYEPRNEVPWGGLAVLAVFFFYLVSQGIAIAAAIRFVGLEDGFDDLLTTTNGRTAFFASILVSSAATVVFGIV